MSKPFNRDTSSEGTPDTKREVDQMIEKDLPDYSVRDNLRRKYNNESKVDQIFSAYKEAQEKVFKRARKFKQHIFNRYRGSHMSGAMLLNKAKKYAKHAGLSDAEFHLFYQLASSDTSGLLRSYNLPNTEMSRTLGYTASMVSDDRLKYSEKELGTVKEIIALTGKTKVMHSQIVIQTREYNDCAAEAISGTLKQDIYATDKNNFYSYVHPIIAALFLPKIDYLDEHMLVANIGNIVKQKYDGRPIVTRPEFELYWDMIVDPTGRACSSGSTIQDLLNRFILQTCLWDNVLNLRQGQYYNDRLSDFLSAIENCRNNIFDAPDLTYVKDEGTILRRLLGAFSMRPTIVSTSTFYGGSYHIPPSGVANLSTIPMITMRLPLQVASGDFALSLDESLNQAEWFVEDKMIIPKSRNILFSRDVLFFYVNRRYQSINITSFQSPYNFTQLPTTVAGWEKVNDTVVNFQKVMQILNETYELRSVVFVESSKKSNMIIGCSSGVIVRSNMELGLQEPTHLIYDPQGSTEKFLNEANEFVRNPPITWIPEYGPLNSNVESFSRKASTHGTIFMYQKVTGGNELRI